MLGDDSKGIYEFICDRLYKLHEEHLPTTRSIRNWERV